MQATVEQDCLRFRRALESVRYVKNDTSYSDTIKVKMIGRIVDNAIMFGMTGE